MTAGDALMLTIAIGIVSLSVLFFGIGIWETYRAGRTNPATEDHR